VHEAVLNGCQGVSSVVSGYMQGAETIQISFDPRGRAMKSCLAFSGARTIQPRSIARGRTLESSIALQSFTLTNSNAQQPRSRRRRRKNRTQNRSQLRLREPDRFVLHLEPSELLQEESEQSLRAANNLTKAAKAWAQQTLIADSRCSQLPENRRLLLFLFMRFVCPLQHGGRCGSAANP